MSGNLSNSSMATNSSGTDGPMGVDLLKVAAWSQGAVVSLLDVWLIAVVRKRFRAQRSVAAILTAMCLESLCTSLSVFIMPGSATTSRLSCALSLTPLTMGVVVFCTLSIVLTLDRLRLTLNIKRQAERELFRTKRDRTTVYIVSVIVFAAFMDLARHFAAGSFRMEKWPEKGLCFFESHPAFLLPVFLSYFCLQVASVAAFLKAQRTARELLDGFAFKQSQIPLSARAQLRATLGLTKTLAPVLMFNLCLTSVNNIATLSSLILFGDSVTHQRATLALTILPPQWLYSGLALWRFKRDRAVRPDPKEAFVAYSTTEPAGSAHPANPREGATCRAHFDQLGQMWEQR